MLGDKQQPLADTEVFFWPNVIWNGRGSTIFIAPSFDSEDLLRSNEDFDWQNFGRIISPLSIPHRRADCDRQPSSFKQWSVSHANYELPIHPVNGDRAATQPDWLPMKLIARTSA